MSYAPKRPKITKAQRREIFERDGGRCYLCGLEIDGNGPWEADHELARELGGGDEIANLRPAHVHCHRIKSKADVKLIAKSNRIRRKFGLDPSPPKKGPPIRSRGFDKGRSRPFPSRQFPKGRTDARR